MGKRRREERRRKEKERKGKERKERGRTRPGILMARTFSLGQRSDSLMRAVARSLWNRNVSGRDRALDSGRNAADITMREKKRREKGKGERKRKGERKSSYPTIGFIYDFYIYPNIDG